MMPLDQMIDQLRASYVERHHCAGCSGSDRLRDEVEPFCPRCSYLMELHVDAGVCPDEAEAAERWGK